MSQAFDRSMDEVHKVWEAADRFDTKVIQLLGIVSAGSLAAAAILAGKPPIAPAHPWGAACAALGIAGASGLVGFFVFSILATMQDFGFDGALDPRIVADYREVLLDDELFERRSMGAIAIAFDASMNRYESKWRLFRCGLAALLIGLSCLSSIAVILFLVPR